MIVKKKSIVFRRIPSSPSGKKIIWMRVLCNTEISSWDFQHSVSDMCFTWCFLAVLFRGDLSWHFIQQEHMWIYVFSYLCWYYIIQDLVCTVVKHPVYWLLLMLRKILDVDEVWKIVLVLPLNHIFTSLSVTKQLYQICNIMIIALHYYEECWLVTPN